MTSKKLYLNVGQMKAGTTYLFTLLKNHRQVSFAEEKELNYFAFKYANQDLCHFKRRLRRSYEMYMNRWRRVSFFILINKLFWCIKFIVGPRTNYWYFSLFDKSKKDIKYYGDLSNIYLSMPKDSIINLKRDFPNIKATIVFREDYERLKSHIYFHRQYENNILDL